jgi:hypothetical protein
MPHGPRTRLGPLTPAHLQDDQVCSPRRASGADLAAWLANAHESTVTAEAKLGKCGLACAQYNLRVLASSRVEMRRERTGANQSAPQRTKIKTPERVDDVHRHPERWRGHQRT